MCLMKQNECILLKTSHSILDGNFIENRKEVLHWMMYVLKKNACNFVHCGQNAFVLLEMSYNSYFDLKCDNILYKSTVQSTVQSCC